MRFGRVLLVLAAIVVAWIVVRQGVAGITSAIANFESPFQRELLFAGKVVNETTGEWPNERLVLVFLKGKEVARTTTGMGEFKKAGEGVHDGFFLLEVENSYKLDKDILQPLDFRHSGSKWWIYREMEEGTSTEFVIPEKNISYVVRIIAGDIGTLPEPMKQPGSISLTRTGEMVVQLSGEASGEATPDMFVEALQIRSESEQLEVNKITVPLNNCGGSALLRQDYIQTQTFIHEYTVETGGGIGVQFKVPVLPVALIAELERRYGFTQGEISTREIAYHLQAEPGSNQVYVITWKEVWEKGEADLLANQELITVPFKVKSNLIYEVDSTRLDCP